MTYRPYYYDDRAERQQQERLDAVRQVLVNAGARSVLDLGCGAGELLARLIEERQFERVLGLDVDPAELAAARELLGRELNDMRLELLCGSFLTPDGRLTEFDAAVLMETIEHIDPHKLGVLEQTIFGHFRSATIIVTTPNREYNVLYGLAPAELRHPDHRFEWTRAKFRNWAQGAAQRHGYRVRLSGIGETHPQVGSTTQMAVFCRSGSIKPSL